MITSSRWVSTNFVSRAQDGRDHAGADHPGGGSLVELASPAIGEGAGERGRKDHRQRGRERHDRWGAEQHLQAGCHHDAAADAEGPESTPETNPIAMPIATSSGVTTSRPSSQELGRPAEHLALSPVGGTLQRTVEGEPATSSISSSRSSGSPPVQRIRKKCTVLRMRVSPHT